MRVLPFHAVLLGTAPAAVWHDNDGCPIGRSTGPGFRLPGTDSRSRCSYCAMLAQQPVRATRIRERTQR